MKTLKIAAISAFAGQIAAILFLLAAGLFLKNSDDPLKHTQVIVCIAAALAGGVCGVLAAFFGREDRVPAGFAAGALLALLTVLLSLLPGSGEKSFLQASVPLLLEIALPGLVCFLFSKKKTGRNAYGKKARKRYGGR